MAEFGYHTEGVSYDNHSGAAVYAGRDFYSPAEDGVLDSIFVFCRKASAGTIQARFALYDESDDSLVAETVEIDVPYGVPDYAWHEAAVVGEVDVFAAKSYYFAFKSSDACFVKAGVGLLAHWYDFDAYANAWGDPYDWSVESGNLHKYSVYATYTPSGPGVTALDYERKTRGVCRGVGRGFALWLFATKRTRLITWLSRWSIRQRRLLLRAA